MSDLRRSILYFVQDSPRTTDDVTYCYATPRTEVVQTLSEMESEGVIRRNNLPGSAVYTHWEITEQGEDWVGTDRARMANTFVGPVQYDMGFDNQADSVAFDVLVPRPMPTIASTTHLHWPPQEERKGFVFMNTSEDAGQFYPEVGRMEAWADKNGHWKLERLLGFFRRMRAGDI